MDRDRIEGKLKGELRCTELLIIGATAVVEGCVKAGELRIEGVVRGEITETRKVEICDRGMFAGNVTAQVLVVREGGVFEGNSIVGPEAWYADPPARTGIGANG